MENIQNLSYIWVLTGPLILNGIIEVAKRYGIKAKNIILAISIMLGIIYFFFENEIKELLPMLNMIALFSICSYEFLIKNLKE